MEKYIDRALSIITGTSMVLFIALVISCKKKEDPKPQPVVPDPPDTEQTTLIDNHISETIVNDIESVGSQAVSENKEITTFRSSGALGLEMAPCATVTAVQSSYTVDFGSGCTGGDGRTRSGRLVFDCSASAQGAAFYRHPGFKMNVSAHNYVVDGHSVTINNKVVENTTPSSIPTGTNPGTNLTWSIGADVSIQKPGGGTITWTCDRSKELLNTSDPNCYRGQAKHIIWSIAQIQLNGTAGGQNAKNESYTVTATNLVRDFACHPSSANPLKSPFISGTVVYTPGTRSARTIDYGNGTCDNTAVLTVNNATVSFIIP